MKKLLLKAIFVLSLVLGLQSNVNAQLVYVPDPNFRAWISQYVGCMIGDSIDPNCPNVLTYKNIFVGGRYITDLTGIEVFVNDSSLDCNSNLLVNLPPLPPSIKWIDCSNNQLTSLPNLPNTLYHLDCSNNQLTTLPNLSSSLTKLLCNGNSITTLPALPTNVTTIDCSDNQLASLPPLPDSLIYLFANTNHFTSLPLLPDSLLMLLCRQNQITSLPSLPNSLYYLQCGSNQLTSLPALPTDLEELYCEQNQIDSLPILPSYLRKLSCFSNQLTSIPELPSPLQALWCDTNQLTSLPEFPNALKILTCNNNPIACLPNLNKVTYLRFSNTLINCLSNYGIVNSSIPTISTIPICNIFNSNGCDVFWNIEGTSYIDLDTNCLISNNEKGYANQKMKLYKNGILDKQTYTNVNGNYDFDTFSNDFYKTEIDTTGLPFIVNCPSAGFYMDTITTTDSIKYDRNFSLKCKGVDLAATSIYSQNLRPASIRTINIQAGDFSSFYSANCAAGVCGTVSITITGSCNYISSPSYALTPNLVSGNVLTYYITDFGAISYGSTFDFNLLVDTTAQLGSQICITVNIYTKCVQELNYNNNQLTQCFTIVGSFDPNDKAVSPTSTVDLSGNRWLTYTIRFQNTGTASAEHIVITDTLSDDLILSTFTLLSSSHDPIVELKVDSNRLLKFQFPYINLPDSNTNEPASHGYVQFKLKQRIV